MKFFSTALAIMLFFALPILPEECQTTHGDNSDIKAEKTRARYKHAELIQFGEKYLLKTKKNAKDALTEFLGVDAGKKTVEQINNLAQQGCGGDQEKLKKLIISYTLLAVGNFYTQAMLKLGKDPVAELDNDDNFR